MAAPKSDALTTKHKQESSRFTLKKPSRPTPRGPV